MKKRILIISLIVVMILSFTGCEIEESTDTKQEAETDRIMSEINNQIGMPDINNFYEKKMAKEIFELRDDSNLVTYAYIVNLEGQFIYLVHVWVLDYLTQYNILTRKN